MKMNTLFVICGTILLVLFVGFWIYLGQNNSNIKIDGNVSLANPNPNQLLYIDTTEEGKRNQFKTKWGWIHPDINFRIGCDTTLNKLEITGNPHFVGITELKEVSISIERFNELRNDSVWMLIDYYHKDGLTIYLWKNKETGKIIEGLSSYPPMRKLNINGFEKAE